MGGQHIFFTGEGLKLQNVQTGDLFWVEGDGGCSTLLTNIYLTVVQKSAGLAGEEEELTKLGERLDKPFTTYGMEISAQKTKLMTTNTSGIKTEIKVNGQKLRQSQAPSTWAQL